MESEEADDGFTAEVASSAVYPQHDDGLWPEDAGIKPSDLVQAMADGLLDEIGELEQRALQIMIGVMARQMERRKEATSRAQELMGRPGVLTPKPPDWLQERTVLREEVNRLRLALERRNRERAAPPVMAAETRAHLEARWAEKVEAAKQAAREAWELAAERRGCGKVPLISTAEAWAFVENVCRNVGENVADWNVYQCRSGCRWPSTAGHAKAAVWHAGHRETRARREAAALKERVGGDPVIDFSVAAARLGLAVPQAGSA